MTALACRVRLWRFPAAAIVEADVSVTRLSTDGAMRDEHRCRPFVDLAPVRRDRF
ncbi:hypothetical protein ACFFGH_17480 [Lysobacter korlensis]|uniref:Uncharacterized protein n=1 Tax=Lysobacter korlensis TaxID=553636 RepID=A0ABV6RT93_9GAMM